MKKRIVCLIFVVYLFSLFSGGSMGAYSASVVEENKYKAYFKKAYELSMPDSDNDFWEYYDEVYEYYSDPNQENAAPDFVVAFCADGYEYTNYRFVLGEYVLNSSYFYPYTPGLFVVTPKDGKAYTLTEAYSEGIDGINEMLELWCKNPQSAYLKTNKLHDLDGDRRITVKEATIIQKHVAELITINNNVVDVDLNVSCPKASFPGFYYPVVYGGDFNYDGEINIKDATAIQKYLVGLPY